jgi:hypothetical protein
MARSVPRERETDPSIRTHRDSDAEGVTTIEQRMAFAATDSLAGFTDRELLPHTDGSAVAELSRLRRAPERSSRAVRGQLFATNSLIEETT